MTFETSLIIPLPPIEVQKEIVRILDTFTKYQDLLNRELELRKKQYEYYRDKLLTFDDEVEYKFLGEVCNVQSGGTPLKTKVEYWENGNIKWLGSGVCENQKTVNEITNYISESGLEKSSAKLMKKDTTLIALVGATIGKVAFLPFEAAINQNIAGVYPIDINKLNPSFVYYICTTYYKDFISLGNGKLTMANLSFVRNLKIPVPPLEEQERIVNILDKFDALCNDITRGLPAEIEMRKKQYEYYRDKLLTFKEKNK
ncbi:restriction endonuclease subunit S [Brachyspira pilosicoli]|uniref:Restriction endonuclease subunit S n=1 Tax=Brachyspira pilosicoli TaxID=52584 RepID=A0A5C8ETD5_BRAPL|nr:restriction endonuclease subunit S [Brachyspira pilosicoli]TXJ40161.1 restriction endonuclease subunit S [Brachyspira pilosicoli]